MCCYNIFQVIIIMFFLMVLQNLFTFIPLILVITINITIFGFWVGFLFSCLSSVIGSTIIFLSIRYLFPNLFHASKFEQYYQRLNENGFKFVLTARILPFLPTNLINIAAGLSGIKVKQFFFATSIGNLIYGFVLASASFSFVQLFSDHPVYATIGLLLAIAIYGGFMWNKKRKKVVSFASQTTSQ